MKDYHHQRDFDFTIEHIIFSLFTISLFLSFSARSLCCQAAVGLTPCRRQSSLAPSCARRSMSAARAASELHAERTHRAASGASLATPVLCVSLRLGRPRNMCILAQGSGLSLPPSFLQSALQPTKNIHRFTDSRIHAVTQSRNERIH